MFTTNFYKRQLKNQISLKSISKSSWAIVDQALFAGSNFIVNIILARWMSQTEYGAFSLAFSIFLLLGIIQSSFWTEPLLIFGSNLFQKRLINYYSILKSLQWKFTLTISLLLITFGIYLNKIDEKELSYAIWGTSIASPFILHMWITRRYCYLIMKPRIAAYGGLTYMLLFVPSAILVGKVFKLNIITAFLLMGVASYLSALAINTKLPLNNKTSKKLFILPFIYRNHWKYGSWSFLAGIFYWVFGNINYILLPYYESLEVVASYKALTNLILPIININVAITGLLIPIFSRAKSDNLLKEKLKTITKLLATSSIIYWIFLILFGDIILKWLYNETYLELTFLLVILGISPICSAITNIYISVLRTFEKSKTITTVYLFGSLLTLGLGVLLIPYYGLVGAIVSFVFTNLVLMLSFYIKVSKLLNRPLEMIK
ncbi:lipopolysaccharide biosynthesis protein [Telluribacter sp.]|jgi:O-antigen/teichoic acid export membrane protein|uniref:lipopolysaccharide biosynthesis protein n=1 Tax=Telluribacter sp. TaxID=1978767 RepID=UPI002E13D483|nr:polysaccharide biosynthesis C-terminal domain-containing protein [Telluribacter sp.]